MTDNVFHKLAALSLDKAGDEFSNQCCNDLGDDEIEIIKNMSTTQKGYFIQMANRWNKGDTFYEPDDLHNIPNWLLMNVLAYILENESE